MIDGSKFLVPYEFEDQAIASRKDIEKEGRLFRLALEAAKIAENLKVSAFSSMFFRSDTNRLDVVKVLITGPRDSPFSWGCYGLNGFFTFELSRLPNAH